MTDLTDAALRPHITPEDIPAVAPPGGPEPSLRDRLAAGKPTEQVLAETKTSPKRRGRPPGSKNKSTLEREARERAVTGSARLHIPPGPKDPTKPDDKPDKPVITGEMKAKRGEYLGVKVAETVNDNLMLLLMSAGVPTELLYKAGRAPVKADSPYTDLAQMITMSTMQANLIGRFLAEVEATDTGAKLTSAGADGKGPLIIYGVLAGASVVQWGRSLAQAYKQLEPILEAYRAAAREEAARREAYEHSKNPTSV